MKKFTAILGLAVMSAGLTFSHSAFAFQTTAPAPSTATTPSTDTAAPMTKAEKRAQKKAAKDAAAPASSTTAPMSSPAPPSNASMPKSTPAPSSGSSTMGQSSMKSTAGKTAKPVQATATPDQIADAKSKGMVWVNKSTKVYHKSNDKYYGATKSGEFMTEADAQKAGAHLAK